MCQDAPTVRLCLNCAAALQGRFCHRCGQRDQERRLPLKALFHDVLHDIWHLDHKVLHSVWLLVRRPGQLTLDYLQGKRVRWVPPFRLYIFVSFVLFAVLSTIRLVGDRRAAAAGAAPAPAPVALTVSGSGRPDAAGNAKPGWAREIQVRGKRAQENPEQYQRLFLANLSKALFLLMPLFAGLLHLTYLRRKTLFVDHMVLSLHHHTLSFLVILGLVGLNALPGDDWGTIPGCLLFFLPPVHLAAALRRIHGQGWGKSLLKAALVSSVYALVVGAALVGLLIYSLPKT